MDTVTMLNLTFKVTISFESKRLYSIGERQDNSLSKNMYWIKGEREEGKNEIFRI